MPFRAGSLPFREAIAYFQGKVNLPTETWRDLWSGMHVRAFTVAGATREDMLVDLRAAVDRAVTQGTTIGEFRKAFDEIVARYGWDFNGGRDWRTRVIYDTNIRTAYQAGRYAQMKAIAGRRPYWRYRHNPAVRVPREEHLGWDGLILRHDNPWWKTHYPPNGWGCRCYVESLSERDLARLGKDGPDEAPDDGAYEWTNPDTGEVLEVPRGIDPGWDYNVGEAAWGDRARLAEAANTQRWEPLTPGDWETYGRPKKLPLAPLDIAVGPKAASRDAFREILAGVIGGEEKIFRVQGREWSFDVVANAGILARHVELDRAPYSALLTHVLENPDEVWAAFEQSEASGMMRLRFRLLKGVSVGGKTMLLVLDAQKGSLVSWTFIPTANWSNLNRWRIGRLV